MMVFFDILNVELIWLCVSFILIILIFQIYLSKLTNKVAVYWLEEALCFDKYIDYVDTLYKPSRRRYQLYYYQEVNLAKAQVSFLKGEFYQSKDLLDKVIENNFSWRTKKSFSNQYNGLKCLNNIHLSQPLESVCEQYQLELDAIQQIVKGGTSTYFYSRQRETRLEKIKIVYYQGLNALNGDNLDEAKRLFESISTENPELFYVQKANDYLGELSHDRT